MTHGVQERRRAKSGEDWAEERREEEPMVWKRGCLFLGTPKMASVFLLVSLANHRTRGTLQTIDRPRAERRVEQKGWPHYLPKGKKDSS